jgi:hypothetical protein
MPGEPGFVRLVTHLKTLPEGIHRKPGKTGRIQEGFV